MRYSKLGAAIAAALLSIGMATPASATPAAGARATGSVVINGYWGVYGQYPSRAACDDVGYYLVYVAHWYSNYSCKLKGSMWELWVYDPL